MNWIPLLVVCILLLVLFVPVTPIVKSESFSVYDGIIESPPELLIRNGQKEEEDIHRRDVLSRIHPYIPEDVQQ